MPRYLGDRFNEPAGFLEARFGVDLALFWGAAGTRPQACGCRWSARSTDEAGAPHVLIPPKIPKPIRR